MTQFMFVSIVNDDLENLRFDAEKKDSLRSELMVPISVATEATQVNVATTSGLQGILCNLVEVF